MSRVASLIDTVIRLKRGSQVEISEHAGIHPSNFSKFLKGETDIRISSLERILDSLDISLDEMLEAEIEKLMGKKKSAKSLGQAFEVIFKEADPILAKTMIETLSARVNSKQKKEITTALGVVNDYKTKIKTVKRRN